MASLPERPRLHDGVIVRRHLAGEHDRVVIHDEASGQVLVYPPVHYRVTALADGTRDTKGILLAAHRAGIEIEEAHLVDFLEQLHAAGVLTDGPGDAPLAETIRPELFERPLVTLPEYAFACSGRGECCGVFPSILFTGIEAARARIMLPQVEHDFLPLRGVTPEGPFVPPLREGRCWYLGEDRRCRLHTAGGFDQKPAGCAIFPAVLTDDGEQIRVTAAVECACVLDGIGAEGPSGLVPEGAATLADLDPATKIGALPERVEVSAGVAVDRDVVRAWFRRLSEIEAPADVAAGLWTMGEAMRDGSLEGSLEAYAAAAAPRSSVLRPWLEAAAQHFELWGRANATFRSERDLTVSALGWITEATRTLVERCDVESFEVPATEPALEAFYVRADAFGYRWIGALPLATAVRIRALRLWIARALPAIDAARGDERASAPLPLVEVVFRAHGLDTFAHGRS